MNEVINAAMFGFVLGVSLMAIVSILVIEFV